MSGVFLTCIRAFLVAGLLAVPMLAFGQLRDPAEDAVRVTVSLNADGSRTTYEFDSLHRKATAATTEKGGKLRGKIRYLLDEAGRFASGDVYGPGDQLRFKTLYKYDASGRLTQETQLSKNDVVQNKIVYSYDNAGKQTGYTVYDGAGKLVSRTAGPSASATPSDKRSR